MDIVSVALARYSTKAFDASKKLTAEQAANLKTLLRYSPSSTNSQPCISSSPAPTKGKHVWRNPLRAATCLTNAKCSMPLTW